MKPRTVPERFWSKVIAIGDVFECWEWTAAKKDGGYGNFWLEGSKFVAAHRFSYERIVGEIPSGLHIDHLCRNRSCVNPWHLEAVTQNENTRRGLAGINNRSKVNCPIGHVYNAVNTYIYSIRQRRDCRICNTEKTRKRRAVMKRSLPNYSVGFESFWLKYPRKIAKLRGFYEWQAWECEDQTSLIIKALEKQIPDFSKRAYEHIPHASTWLHQRRWEDEVKSTPTVSSIRPLTGTYKPPRCEYHTKHPNWRRRDPVDWCAECKHQTARESKRVTTEDDLFGNPPDWMEVAKGGKR